MIVYKLTNLINGKNYVGQTVQTLEKRFNAHKYCKKSIIGNAIKKYGAENFSREVLAVCSTKGEMDELERFFIEIFNCKFPNGYNIADGGGGGSVRGRPCSAETRAKLSAANSGQIPWNKGKHLSAETRSKLSKSLKGNRNGSGNKGRAQTSETRAKISQSLIGNRNGSGYSPTTEERARISQALMGNTNAAGNKGRKLSDETRAKISAGIKARLARKKSQDNE